MFGWFTRGMFSGNDDREKRMESGFKERELGVNISGILDYFFDFRTKVREEFQ